MFYLEINIELLLCITNKMRRKASSLTPPPPKKRIWLDDLKSLYPLVSNDGTFWNIGERISKIKR